MVNHKENPITMSVVTATSDDEDNELLGGGDMFQVNENN
jgi:hypothetical protein